MKRLSYILFLFTGLLTIYGQENTLTIRGKLWDNEKNTPVAFATIAAKSLESSKVIKGTVSGDDGIFLLKTNSSNVYIEISFMGYETKTIKDFNRSNSLVDLGKITLRQDAELLDEVVVQGEKSTVEFKLDKKIFNVGKDISSTGMGALEVLNNVPSVNVDLEGTITLRGNSGVQILIDGKPSVLADEGSNALGTITADMIERIEVMTNPSAKYDAEGTSGIINIVLKKEEKEGLNGSISFNTGIPDYHSIGGSLNKRANKFNLFTQFGGGYRTFPEYSKTTNNDLVNDSRLDSKGESYKHEQYYNITLGSDYYINKFNLITLSGSFAYEFENEESLTNYAEYSSRNELNSQWQRNEETTAENPKWQFDLQYEKQFEDNEDHKLLASAQGNFFGKVQSSDYTNTWFTEIEQDDDQKINTDFNVVRYTYKVDYTNPISEEINLEAGGAYTINDIGNEYSVSDLTDGIWIEDPNLSNDFKLNQKVLGTYTTFSYELEKWGVKAGLRLENTNLSTLLKTTNENNTQNYTNLFPSIHTSYKLSNILSLQLGYSRRIYRPRLWDLNPFFNIRNSYYIQTGNPELAPQYADSYELTSILAFKKLTLNTSLYHLYTTDVIERVSEYENMVVTSTPKNIGTNNKTGLSMDGKYTPAKWLSLNGDINFGIYKRQGSYNNESFDMSGNQWSGKLTSKIKFPADIDLEISGNYHSSRKTVQGDNPGSAFANIGLRKKILKGKFVINASIQDVFKSRKRESYIYQPDYTSYSFSERGRFYKIGLSYSFGKGEAMYYYGGKR
jgi:outer membrane receptor protein involved in Fe transport